MKVLAGIDLHSNNCRWINSRLRVLKKAPAAACRSPRRDPVLRVAARPSGDWEQEAFRVQSFTAANPRDQWNALRRRVIWSRLIPRAATWYPKNSAKRCWARFEQSGMSAPKFAAIAAIKYSTFARWLQPHR